MKLYVLCDMSIENKNESCRCKELAEKVVTAVKDNERLAQILRDLRQENDELRRLRNRCSACSGSNSGTTGDDKRYKEKFEALVKINHGWKKDYEELQMRCEMLKGEKRLLEDEEKELKLRINELEKRQGPLENELARLAVALYAQQSSSNGGPSEEHCEILKSQMIVYKEDFEKERKDRGKLHEEKEKYKHKLEDSEEIIKKLTRELDAGKAREEARRGSWSENGYLSERVASPPRHQLQYVYPYHPVDQGWRMEQQRRGILPRNPPPTSLFYGGEVEVDELRA